MLPFSPGAPAPAAAGVAVLVYGLRLGAPLLYGFAPVGILVGAGQLHYWLRPPRERMHWWFQHMGGMIASGIGALTAFLVSNAPRLHLPRWSIWVWLSPTLVGVPCLWLWQRYYRRRLRRRPGAGTGIDAGVGLGVGAAGQTAKAYDIGALEPDEFR